MQTVCYLTSSRLTFLCLCRVITEKMDNTWVISDDFITFLQNNFSQLLQLANQSNYTNISLTNISLISDQIYSAEIHNYTDCMFSNDTLNDAAEELYSYSVCLFYFSL